MGSVAQYERMGRKLGNKLAQAAGTRIRIR
jgi:hypothetical protein